MVTNMGIVKIRKNQQVKIGASIYRHTEFTQAGGDVMLRSVA